MIGIWVTRGDDALITVHPGGPVHPSTKGVGGLQATGREVTQMQVENSIGLAGLVHIVKFLDGIFFTEQ
jgi:hypothetical protein